MIDTWFGVGETSTLGFLHLPDDGIVTGGVIVCTALGYDHDRAYRGLNYLGQELAEGGVAALRFDYSGEGDAGGETGGADAPERWLTSIREAAAYLRASGIEKVGVLALGSGALLAIEAIGDIPDVEGMILWDPALSGRRFLRRQRTLFELTIGSAAPPVDGASAPMISLDLHPDAAGWLAEREITAERIVATGLPTLVLGRSADASTPATTRLAAALGDRAEYRSITGQEEWLDAPAALAELPLAASASITEWFGRLLDGAATRARPTRTIEAPVGVDADGVPIIERIRRFGPERLLAIETVPGAVEAFTDRGMVVLQPGAAEHRTGPSRFQVIAARELARRGFRAVRFDRRVTGDSTTVVPGEPNLIFASEWIDDTEQLIAELGEGAPIALAGLCAGGWVAARATERVPTRLTVLFSPNYFKTHSLRPNEFSHMTRVHRDQSAPIIRIKAAVRDRIPDWLWRSLSGFQREDAYFKTDPGARNAPKVQF